MPPLGVVQVAGMPGPGEDLGLCGAREFAQVLGGHAAEAGVLLADDDHGGDMSVLVVGVLERVGRNRGHGHISAKQF